MSAIQAAPAFPLLLASLSALVVGMSKGGLPMVGMLAVPVLALAIPPVAAAAILLPIFILTDVVSVGLYWRHASRLHLKIMVPPALLGVVLGWATAGWVSDRGVGLMIGLLGLAFCLNAWLGPRLQAVRPPAAGPATVEVPPPSRAKGWFWGTMAGFTSFVAHAGAPPFQIYMLPQRLPKLGYAGTATLTFAVVNAAKLPAYLSLRPYTAADLQHVLWMVPAGLIGTVIGAWATRRLTDLWFFRLVQASLFAVSLKLVWDFWRG